MYAYVYCVDFLCLIPQYIYQWFWLIFLHFVFWLTSDFYFPIYLFLIGTNFFFCSLRSTLEALLWTALLAMEILLHKANNKHCNFFTCSVFTISTYFTCYYITESVGWQLLVNTGLLISDSMKENISFCRNHRWICNMSRFFLCDQICHGLAWLSIFSFFQNSCSDRIPNAVYLN